MNPAGLLDLILKTGLAHQTEVSHLLDMAYVNNTHVKNHSYYVPQSFSAAEEVAVT